MTAPTRAPGETGPDHHEPDDLDVSPAGHSADSTGSAEPALRPASANRRGAPAWLRTDLGARIGGRLRRWNDIDGAGWVARVVTLLAVAGASAWVLHTLHPDLLLADTTPAGGDMGAHVWGPMYLIRHVLPQGQLSGWSPDWYAGFPAYQFYMVVPSLVIVVLTVGLHGGVVVPAAVACAVLAVSGWVVVPLARFRRVLLGLAGFLFVLAMPLPYNVSFKVVTVLGLVSLPVCCWAFARLADLRFPTPAIMAVGSLLFIYNLEPRLNGGTGNIIGGNMASTMAGEFAFSLSLSACVLYLGVLVRGLRTGRHRALAAALLALTGLCHLIPVFFALAATVVILVVHVAGDGVSWVIDRRRGIGSGARLRWLAPVMVVAGLVPAFWVVPFLARHAYVNDMGWEKLPHAGQDIWDYLRPEALTLALIAAGVGLLISVVMRIKVGIALGLCVLLAGVVFVFLPQARLWNARVLPFYYLCTFLLAALAVGELVRSLAVLLSRRPDRPSPALGALATVVFLAGVLVFTGLPMADVLPGAERSASDNVARWPAALGSATVSTKARSDVSGWARWNYTGYERKDAYAEYHDIVATMDRLGDDGEHGCGRAFWEYGFDRLNPYGTPMALMLLPFWTDSCIGSMEGLFFESAATTPYHFLLQTELSEKPSSAQRDLPYGGFDLDQGIRHLQLLGVKYYLAFSPTAVQAASGDARLREVATSGPWHVYEVADSSVVTPLANEPAVLTNVDDTQPEWLPTSVNWFTDPARTDVMLTNGGPDDWQQVAVSPTGVETTTTDGIEVRPRVGTEVELPAVDARPLPEVAVSDVATDDNSISFTVDRPGVPVLVKASYFPNWEVSGADGPYRVAPNLMVVVPTDTSVALQFGRTEVEWVAYVLTFLGLIGLLALARAGPVAMPQPATLADRRRRRAALDADRALGADARSGADATATAIGDPRPETEGGPRLVIGDPRLEPDGGPPVTTEGPRPSEIDRPNPTVDLHAPPPSPTDADGSRGRQAEPPESPGPPGPNPAGATGPPDPSQPGPAPSG